jgi:hypothetical protein
MECILINPSEPANPECVRSKNRCIKLVTLISVSVSTFMLPLDYTIVAVASINQKLNKEGIL